MFRVSSIEIDPHYACFKSPPMSVLIRDNLESYLGKIHHEDCVTGMIKIPDGAVDLVFADPPFNIGYEYDEYDDRLDEDKYLEWSEAWMGQVHRVLKSDGTFWLAIGDEYAAELKLVAKKLGFHMRNWVIWYYTFGVHCSTKFTRSHAHLFYFIKDPKKFTFNFPDVAVPSARQLVYNDRRSNPSGRSPDDTWILRPQDCVEGFQANEDTWYIPRVAGTFKERAGFHGCQMPEQLLGRIIRGCSNKGELVIDPFSGSSTTLTVAKKLERRFFGYELSKEYFERGTTRIDNALPGDRLEGADEPKGGAPSTYEHLSKAKIRKLPLFEKELQDNSEQAIEAFQDTYRGFSVDRVIVDPILNEDFQKQCDRRSIPGTIAERNKFLLQLQKSGKLKKAGLETNVRTEISWAQIDPFLDAVEIAWSNIGQLYSATIEDIFCDPRLATEFDRLAIKFAPGKTSLEYRWAAIKMRNDCNAKIKNDVQAFKNVRELFQQESLAMDAIDTAKLRNEPAVYAIKSTANSNVQENEDHSTDGKQPQIENNEFLYIGETFDLKNRLERYYSSVGLSPWLESGKNNLQLQIFYMPLNARFVNQIALLKSIPVGLWNFAEG